MRVAISEAVVRMSHWYIACYRRSDSEDGTKRSELEETMMGDGGGSIPFSFFYAVYFAQLSII